MSSTQMNVRIDEEIKARGDEALASIDYSPSRMVQAVWSFAARNRQNRSALRALAKLVEEPAQPHRYQEGRRKRQMLEQGLVMREEMLAHMGVNNIPNPIDIPDEELLYQAYLDKTEEQKHN